MATSVPEMQRAVLNGDIERLIRARVHELAAEQIKQLNDDRIADAMKRDPAKTPWRSSPPKARSTWPTRRSFWRQRPRRWGWRQ